ncbi:MAG: hypothetical protein Q9203_003971 [Teloschistes exilis]
MPAPGSSATTAPRPTPTPLKIPKDLSLIVKYESLEADQKKETYHRGYHGNEIWKPPNVRNAFIRHQTQAMIIRWEGGKATVPSKEDICRKPQMKPHDAATLFVQSESDNFWAVPFDAEKQDVKEHPGGWNVLSFDHERQNGNTNAIYSSISTVGSEPRLAAVGSPDWMPQLLPKEYDYNPARTDDEPAVSAGLIGSLSLLFALPAFSVPPEQLPEVLTGHLRPNKWHRHIRKPGREYCPVGLFMTQS